MSFLRPIQWYHSHADPIWQDSRVPLKTVFCSRKYFFRLRLWLCRAAIRIAAPAPDSSKGYLENYLLCLKGSDQ